MQNRVTDNYQITPPFFHYGSCLVAIFFMAMFLSACQLNALYPQLTSCEDYADNDADGWFDAEDPDCMLGAVGVETAYSSSACNDGLDNDGDLLVDHADGNCSNALDTSENISEGEVVVNEFLANPNAVADVDGEWIELHNLTRASVNLLGWQISDASSVHIINLPLVIHSGGYVVLVRNNNAALNGGVLGDYQYESISLNNASDVITLREPYGELIDQWVYSNSESGVSAIKFDDNICLSAQFFGDGDRGSPGRENASCF